MNFLLGAACISIFCLLPTTNGQAGLDFDLWNLLGSLPQLAQDNKRCNDFANDFTRQIAHARDLIPTGPINPQDQEEQDILRKINEEIAMIGELLPRLPCDGTGANNHLTPQAGTLELADGRKFVCHRNGMTRNDAHSHCRGLGMRLPTVRDQPTLQRIVNHCNIKDGGLWVDAKRETTGNFFLWSTGSVIEGTHSVHDGECVEILLNNALKVVNCNQKRWVVCEHLFRG